MKDVISFEEMDLERENDGYEEFLKSVSDEFLKQTKNGTRPMFTTDAAGLFDLFLDNLPQNARQHYTCNACRHFVTRFGGLVTIGEETGAQHPVMWSTGVPQFFEKAVDAVRKKVKSARVTGVFVTSEHCLGIPVTGSWEHMSVQLPHEMVFSDPIKTSYQRAAELREDRNMLRDAIRKYDLETVKTAVKLLRSEQLYRSEKVLGVAEWFLGVIQSTQGKRRNQNIIWAKVATAPIGFCHISSSMIGTLLDDIQSGMNFGEVSRRFAEKMNPTQYQRPQAAPTEGNVVQAEKLVKKLGIERSLRRRFARLDEVNLIWKPAPIGSNRRSGIFSGVATKTHRGRERFSDGAPEVVMTWEKFRRTVLPRAKNIDFLVTGKSDSYAAILTAEDPYAPPILQWDSERQRNPFSWYVYSGGSYPHRWNLTPGFVKVTGILLQPNMWYGNSEHNGKAVIFILDGAKDKNYRNAGIGLFPEILKSSLREVRATIEAYSQNETLGGFDSASACGIRCQSNSKWWDYTFRVTDSTGTTTYKLDRWD